MKGNKYLGLDLGTSAVKAVLVNEEGEVERSGQAMVPAHLPRPGFFEQDAEETLSAVGQAVRECLAGVEPSSLRAVGFSSAMHGLIALDRHGSPLMRQITWADGRAQAQAQKLREQYSSAEVYARTGCPLTHLYFPAKLAWLREEAPEIFHAADKFCSLKDYVLFRLTGELVMDRSQASSHGLINLRNGEWDDLALTMAGIQPRQLPELCSPEKVMTGLLPLGRDFSLPLDLMLIPGGGDGGLANLGSGAVKPGVAAVTIGTSGAMRLLSPSPVLDVKERTWCYLLTENTWFAGGAINSGGIVYRWARDALFPEVVAAARAQGHDPYDDLNQMAGEIPPGAEGLIFLPYLLGERTPHWDPLAQGALIGLRPHHTRNHVLRAAMEGVCFCLASVQKVLAAAAGEIKEIRASGGFSRSELWLKILADVLGKPVSVPKSQEGSALGAAFLAMRATGRLKTLAEVEALVPVERTMTPDPALHVRYQELFAIFEELYPRLKEIFHRLHRLGS